MSVEEKYKMLLDYGYKNLHRYLESGVQVPEKLASQGFLPLTKREFMLDDPGFNTFDNLAAYIIGEIDTYGYFKLGQIPDDMKRNYDLIHSLENIMDKVPEEVDFVLREMGPNYFALSSWNYSVYEMVNWWVLKDNKNY